MAFVYSVIVTLGVGSLMTFTVKVKDRVLAKKDGYFIVAYLTYSEEQFRQLLTPYSKPCPVSQQQVPR